MPLVGLLFKIETKKDMFGRACGRLFLTTLNGLCTKEGVVCCAWRSFVCWFKLCFGRNAKHPRIF